MMRRLATMTAVLALGLTGCTGGDDPDPTSDGTGGDGGTTASSELRDRSGEVFGAYEEAEVLGSTSGTVRLGIGKQFRQFEEDVTFEVTEVRATPTTTILRYQLTADDGDAQFGMEGRFWYDQPSLQSPGSDEQLQAVTATQPERGNDDQQDICVCTSVRSAGEEPRPQSVVYGPLPEDAPEVDVLLPGLDPVTVPVTR